MPPQGPAWTSLAALRQLAGAGPMERRTRTRSRSGRGQDPFRDPSGGPPPASSTRRRGHLHAGKRRRSTPLGPDRGGRAGFATTASTLEGAETPATAGGAEGGHRRARPFDGGSFSRFPPPP